jgi:hypothetical protein
MPNSFFKLTSSFEAIHEAPHMLPLWVKPQKTWLHLASPERSFLPDVFQNRFSFAREAALLEKLLHPLFQKKLKLCQMEL